MPGFMVLGFATLLVIYIIACTCLKPVFDLSYFYWRARRLTTQGGSNKNHRNQYIYYSC